MAEINLTKNDSGSSKINLIKNDSSLKVNLVKGANQDAINSLYTQTKELRDETNELKDIASTKATEASNSAAIALEAIQDLTDLTVAAVEGATANASYNDATNTLTLTLVKGDKGDTGEQGIQGIKGDTGEQGIQGIQGIKGDKGDTGEQGIQGPIGPTGPQGIQGAQGIKGDTGDTGPQGPQGVQGVKGDTGLTGPQGIQGIQGKGIDTVTSNKVGLTTTVTLTGDFDNSPYSFNIQDGTSTTGDMLKSTYDANNNGIVDNAQMLTLDTSNTVAPTTIGQVKWNIDENTADLNLGNVTLQLGQEQLVRVRNDHTSTILNGRVVMATGTLGNSGRILVKPHTGTQALAKTVIGVATEDITVGSDGFVTVFGKVRGIDTTGSSVGETWVDGDVLYVKPNDNGALTKVVPSDTDIYMSVAYVIKAHTNGTLFVRINGVDENRSRLVSGTSIKTINNTSILGSGNIDTTQTTITGNAGTATKLQTARAISITGDVSYTSALFDGSADVSGTATLSNTGVSAGTYKSVTVDAKGRITKGTNPTTLSGYGITDAQPLLVSGTNIKTINSTSILGSGNIDLVNLTTNQSIGGIKTFTSSPTAPTPTNATDVANKTYVDNSISLFSKIVRGTVVNSTSGTSIDFTGLPTWIKKITIMLNGVSTTGTSLLIQIGSGSVLTTGYVSGSTIVSTIAGNDTSGTTATTGFVALTTAASNTSGNISINLISDNTWINSMSLYATGYGNINANGKVTLSGTLDRVRITTVNGTGTFDAGQINIMYEG